MLGNRSLFLASFGYFLLQRNNTTLGQLTHFKGLTTTTITTKNKNEQKQKKGGANKNNPKGSRVLPGKGKGNKLDEITKREANSGQWQESRENKKEVQKEDEIVNILKNKLKTEVQIEEK